MVAMVWMFRLCSSCSFESTYRKWVGKVAMLFRVQLANIYSWSIPVVLFRLIADVVSRDDNIFLPWILKTSNNVSLLVLLLNLPVRSPSAKMVCERQLKRWSVSRIINSFIVFSVSWYRWRAYTRPSSSDIRVSLPSLVRKIRSFYKDKFHRAKALVLWIAILK